MSATRVTHVLAAVAYAALCAAGLGACGRDVAATTTSVSTGATEAERTEAGPIEAEAIATALLPVDAHLGTLGITPWSDPIPPSPWLALELRFEEGDHGRDSWSRTTLVRLERGVLRMRTHDEPSHDEEPDLDASVVLDEATTQELASAMRAIALLRDVADVAEPEGLRYSTIAAVLERDAVRTRVVVENPVTLVGADARAAMERVIAIARQATAPPAPPP